MVHRHHGYALVTITAAAVLDTIGGLWFSAVEHVPASTGLYWAISTATTTGYGDVAPHDPAGRRVAVLVMVTVIPLFGASFSLYASAMSHAGDGERRLAAALRHWLRRMTGR